MLKSWAMASGFVVVLTIALGGSALWAFLPQLPIFDDCTQRQAGDQHTPQRAASPDNKRTERRPITGGEETSNPEKGNAYRECEHLQAEVGLTYWTRRLVFVGVGTAVVLVFQSVFLGWTVFLTRKSIDLARKEFVSSHRPQLRIRRTRPTRFEANGPVYIMIEAANIGDTNATIESIGFDVYRQGGVFDAVPRPYPGVEPVEAGRQANIAGRGNQIFTAPEINRIQAGTLLLRLLGIINYRDENGILRSTSFARRYNVALQRFVAVAEDDPEADRNFEN
jgi:hypothetical protein